MSSPSTDALRTARRSPLTRERVLGAAIELADREGVEAVSMRRLGQELGVEAMSLYTHVRSKDDLLAGMADVVVAEVALPALGETWKGALRSTILAAREVMLRHHWAPTVLESRAEPGPATLRYIDAILGIMRGGGLSVDVCHHALHVLGSRVLGFSQDLFEDGAEQDSAAVAAFAAALAETHPHVVEIALAASHEGGLGPCDDDVEFRYALDLILDGLESRASAVPPARSRRDPSRS
jgi:AcrR family transcriptional regulator